MKKKVKLRHENNFISLSEEYSEMKLIFAMIFGKKKKFHTAVGLIF